MNVDWDEEKRQANITKHGIDFVRAALVFDGRPVWLKQSTYQGEDRWLSCSIVDQRFMTVVWTKRGTTIRIISARRSRDAEKRNYRQLHG